MTTLASVVFTLMVIGFVIQMPLLVLAAILVRKASKR